VSTSEAARRAFDLAEAMAHRAPSAPESSIEIGVTAKRLHTWTVTVRGEDVNECARIAQRIDDELAAKFADEVDTESLAGKLARSVTP
jgi:hypothetical protein